MKNYFLKNVISFFLFIVGVFSHAQTINIGDMAIKEGTSDVITFFDFINTGDLINDGNFHIKANYTNSGTVSHNNKGTTLFTGGSKQALEAGTSTFLQNVIFNNPFFDANDNTTFDLTGEMNVEGEVDFKNGIVNNKTTSGTIIFWENATVATGAANDNSYVNGEVIKNGDQKFEFPIGATPDKYYRYASISAPKEKAHSATGEYFFNNSDPSYSHESKVSSIVFIDDTEYWNMTGVDELVLTLSWDERTTPERLVKNPKSIRIARWDEERKEWRNAGGIPDENSRTVKAPVRGNGIFTLALVEDNDNIFEIYNAISPNTDNKNDTFEVELVEESSHFKKLKVKIFNRWGVLVYESNDKYYMSEKEKFRGFSDGRATIDKGSTLLPRGTYFYILEYEYTDVFNKDHSGTKTGYLYLANDPTLNGTL